MRNIRVSGGGELRLGSTREAVVVVELPDAEKPPVLRAYLERWWFEVGRFFEGIAPDASLDDLRRISPGFPVSDPVGGDAAARLRRPSESDRAQRCEGCAL